MALFQAGTGSQLFSGLGAGRCSACEVTARWEDHRKYLEGVGRESGPRKRWDERSVAVCTMMPRKIRLSEICKAPLLTEEESGNAQKHYTGSEEALNVQNGP